MDCKAAGAVPITWMAPTRSGSTISTSTSASDASSVNSSSYEGEVESKTMKARNLQICFVPGSLLATGAAQAAMPLALTLQHYGHAGVPVMTLPQPYAP
jgi:hypothetical protein